MPWQLKRALSFAAAPAGTGRHLQALARNREYLVTRYYPEAAGGLSELNRLSATLEEITSKVSRLLEAA
jgi:hypothetical protein